MEKINLKVATGGGRIVDLLDYGPEDVDIEEIANALAKICRYNGQTNRFYSVAEHCILLSNYTWTMTTNRRAALYALLHDSHEAYLGDVTAPVQKLFRRTYYDLIADKINKTIFEEIKLEIDHHLITKVHLFDLKIRVDEMICLIPAAGLIDLLWEDEPLGVELECWPWMKAAQEFMERYRSLTQISKE